MTTETTETKSEENPLYAGKYKSVNDLEDAVVHKDKENAKLFNENKQLKEKYIVPEKYSLPREVALREHEIQDIEEIARNAGMTQEQFEKIAKDRYARLTKHAALFDEQKKKIGEANMNVIDSYVKEKYPASLHETILTKVIKDEKAMSDILSEREKALNSKLPGTDSAGFKYSGDSSKKNEAYDGQLEVRELAREVEANPRDMALREKFIETARDVGHARQER